MNDDELAQIVADVEKLTERRLPAAPPPDSFMKPTPPAPPDAQTVQNIPREPRR